VIGEAWEIEKIKRLRKGDDVKGSGPLRHFATTWEDLRAFPWVVTLPDDEPFDDGYGDRLEWFGA
jgi:hypothetical protein